MPPQQDPTLAVDPPAAPVPASPGAPVSQLAFAAKIQPAGASAAKLPAVNPQARAGSPASAPPVSGPDHSPKESGKQHSDTPSNSAHKDKAAPAKTAAVAELAHPADASAQPLFNSAATDKSAAKTLTTPPESATAPGTRARVELVAEPPATPSAPMKDLSLRIDAPEGKQVDITIAQRAGDLRMAVRAADGDIVQSLRQGLSDLTNRLADNNFHADTWRPAHGGAVAESRLETQNSSNHAQHGDAQSNSGGSQQERGQRQNNPNRPRWVEELESTFNAAAVSKGETYGISS